MTEDKIATELGSLGGKLDMLIQRVTDDAIEARDNRKEMAARVTKIERNQSDLLKREDETSRRLDRVENTTSQLSSKATRFAGGMAVVGFLLLAFKDKVAAVFTGN